MNRRTWQLIALIVFTTTANAQTLFSYGKYSVGVKEFQRAYEKTNTTPPVSKEKAIREYLDLYIASKLKVREAYDRKYDTTASFKTEISSLRAQVANNYMTDTAALNKLEKEAFARSHKDIHVSHIFIPYTVQNGNSDSAMAKLQINEAYMQLRNGKSFEETALQFSKDPDVRNNKGDIGFITVFTLPYEFENIIYNLAPGKYAAPYKSSFGYHIFKNDSERKAVGKIKAAQILFAIPPGSEEADKEKIKKSVDSVYTALLKGADFGNLAKLYSNDNVSAASNGMIPDFTTGTYDPVFENAILSLPKEGEISKPFTTSHGFHIVKRISLTPPPATLDDKIFADDLKSRLLRDQRSDLVKESLYKKIIAKAGYKQLPYNEKELWLLADSLIDFRQTGTKLALTNETPLFKLGDSVRTVNDFIKYALLNRYKPGGGVKTHQEAFDEYKMKVATDYYQEHLEEFNEEFRYQMNELKDGNMFFEIMMKEVWSKAQTDTTGLESFYNRNKVHYQWKNSAEAVLFYCADETVANQFYDIVKQDPSKWKELVQQFGERITVDSGRFETSRIPGTKNLNLKEGLLTPVTVNKEDNSALFSYVLKLYSQPAQKTYVEAKADVVTDYQNDIESKWVAQLKKKYPVKVNETVLRTLFK